MCVMCQRGGPMNGRGMKGRKEDGPAVEESRCVRSIPIVYTYRTWRRRLSWVCPISRAQHPAFVSCVLSLFLSRTCLYRSLAFPCPWSIPSKGHRTLGFIKPSTGSLVLHPLVKPFSRGRQLMEQREDPRNSVSSKLRGYIIVLEIN